MPWFKRLPEIETCCGCVPDLKAATAIIAVIGLISSPAMSWTMVRHSYIIRVACYVTTSSDRVDVMDLTLNNIVSFGFGVNAGLGPSCMSYKENSTTTTVKPLHQIKSNPYSSKFVTTIRYFGWVVLFADVCFAIVCVSMLGVVFKKPSYRHVTLFMFLAFFSILFSCVYGILYVAACVNLGGALPLFELFFSFFDMLIWIYFLMVVKTFRAVSFGVSIV